MLALTSATLLTGVLAGCGNTDSWVDPIAACGWSAQYADARNSSYTATEGAGALPLSWTRSVRGELGAAPHSAPTAAWRSTARPPAAAR